MKGTEASCLGLLFASILIIVSCPQNPKSVKKPNHELRLSAADEKPKEKKEVRRKGSPTKPEGITGVLPLAKIPDNPAVSPYGTVVIDPGHGTRDSIGQIVGQGTKGMFQGKPIPEHALALDYGMWLLAELRRRGIRTFSTRSYDSPWFQVSYQGHSQEESNRLRAEFALQHQAILFVRIHFDGSPNPRSSGFSVWYNDQSQFDSKGEMARQSLRVARLISQQLAAVMELPNLGIKRFSRPIYGFIYARQPSVLLELAFLSTESDCAYVMQELTLHSITEAVAHGIEEYLRLEFENLRH